MKQIFTTARPNWHLRFLLLEMDVATFGEVWVAHGAPNKSLPRPVSRSPPRPLPLPPIGLLLLNLWPWRVWPSPWTNATDVVVDVEAVLRLVAEELVQRLLCYPLWQNEEMILWIALFLAANIFFYSLIILLSWCFEVYLYWIALVNVYEQLMWKK